MQLAVTASNSCNSWSRCTANRYIIDYAWCMRRSIYINITRLIRYRRPTFEYRVITARRYANALLCCGTMSVRLSVTSRVVSKRLNIVSRKNTITQGCRYLASKILMKFELGNPQRTAKHNVRQGKIRDFRQIAQYSLHDGNGTRETRSFCERQIKSCARSMELHVTLQIIFIDPNPQITPITTFYRAVSL